MITAGKIVKFVDEKGEISAGTVTDIIKKDGIRKALINTIDGKKISKVLSDIFLVKNSVRGKRSSTLLKEVAASLGKEIVTIDVQKQLPPIVSPGPIRSITPDENSPEEENKKLYQENDILKSENEELKKNQEALERKIEELKNYIKQPSPNAEIIRRMEKTISYLTRAIEAKAVGSDFEMITELTSCIKMLNGLITIE